MEINFNNLKGKVKKNYNISHLTWFKTGGDAKIFYVPYSLLELSDFLKNNKQNDITIIGAGSNIIIRDGGINGAVIKLGKNFSNIEVLQNNIVKVGAGILNLNFAKFCSLNQIGGLEFLSTIPGTIGGGVFMNAGCYYKEFKDIISKIDVIDYDGVIKTLSCEDINFSYRKTNLDKFIVLSAYLKYEKDSNENIKNNIKILNERRKTSQPTGSKTGGSTFKNTNNKKAWELIDKSGLRGMSINSAKISEKHCNFMINTGNSNSSDLELLGEKVIKIVKEKTGVELEWEIKIIGNK